MCFQALDLHSAPNGAGKSQDLRAINILLLWSNVGVTFRAKG